MEKQDKTLVCVDCGKEFIFSAGEQAFFEEKGFVNTPKRCKACGAINKEKRANKSNRSSRPNDNRSSRPTNNRSSRPTNNRSSRPKNDWEN